MSDFKIPPEAVEAAVEAIKPLRHNPFITDSQLTRAAIRAVLAAWPGMTRNHAFAPGADKPWDAITLPLSQETRND